MQHIVPVRWIDTQALGAVLYAKRDMFGSHPIRTHAQSPHAQTKCIVLREPAADTVEAWSEDTPHRDAPALGELKAARRMLDQIKTAAGRVDDISRAIIVLLPPGGVVPWHIDGGPYYQRHLRIHVPVFTNPGAMLYSGGEAANLQTGVMSMVNNLVLHGAVNWGASPRIHLIVDVRRPDAEEAT